MCSEFLIPKHKFRFNLLGNSRWAGRIYGDISGALLAARPVVYHGAFGMGLFKRFERDRLCQREGPGLGPAQLGDISAAA